MANINDIDPDYCPLVISFGKKNETGISFINLNDTVNVKLDSLSSDVLIDIVYLCNGHRTVAEIGGLVPSVSENLLNKIFRILIDNEIVVDSREFYKVFHSYSCFPLTTARDISPEQIDIMKAEMKNVSVEGERFKLDFPNGALAKLLVSRESQRDFKDVSIKFEQLSGVLFSLYANKDNTNATPSAGGFYPLRIFTYLKRDIGPLRTGLYQYDHLKNELVKIIDSMDGSQQILSITIGSALLKNASACIFVAGNFSGTTAKYSNRGYRHVLIEAGHAAQNAYLYCAEQDLGIVEFGGYNDKELANWLKLNYPSEAVLTTLILGVKGAEVHKFTEPFVNEEYKIRKDLVGPDKPIKGVSSTVFRMGEYSMPYYVSCATYSRYAEHKNGSKKTFSSFGMGSTLVESRFKSFVEGYERYSSGVFRIDARLKRSELGKSYFDLDDVGPQRNEYKKNNELGNGVGDYTRSWVLGTKLLTDDKVYVPVEQVFYPFGKEDLGHKLSYRANSSGVAAHTKKEFAINNALLELIERDACAVMWYGKRACTQISEKAFSADIQVRVEKLASLGHTVNFLDISLDSCPVVICIICSQKYPYTTVGCSANLDYKEAGLKAFNEAEFILHSWMKADRKPKAIQDVRSSTDHGDLFSRISMASEPDFGWLFSGPIIDVFPDRKALNMLDLLSKFDPIVVDLNESSRLAGLCVVRVLSDKLIPFAFGYGSEHYGHPRMEMLGFKWSWGYPGHPHLIA